MNDELKNNCDCKEGECDCSSNEDQEQYLTLTMENDEELTCAVIAIFPVKDKDYIALLPLNEEGEEDSDEILIYAYSEDEEGNPVLDNIESDEEYELIGEKFDEFVDSLELDEE